MKTQSRGVFADAKEENEEKKGGGKKTGMGSKAKGFVQIDDSVREKGKKTKTNNYICICIYLSSMRSKEAYMRSKIIR